MKDSFVIPDTNVLILAIAGNAFWQKRMRQWAEQGMILISPIVIAEFLCKATDEERSHLKDLVRISRVIEIDEQVAYMAADIKKTFMRRIKRSNLLDNLIAAQCVEHGAILATENVNDYPQDLTIITKNTA